MHADKPTLLANGRSFGLRRRFAWFVGIVATLVGVWAAVSVFAKDGEMHVVKGEVIKTFPHDPAAYCQGLVIHDGVMFEGTGQYGESTLRRVNLETGKVEKQLSLDRRIFGEGITFWDDKIIQLSWKERTAFVYQRDSFNLVDRFRYAGEGWGITTDGTNLIMSDGSATLRFIDPKTHEVSRRLTVRAQGKPVWELNELEYINGQIWANVWFQDYIVVISPETGQVSTVIDLRHLFPAGKRRKRDYVLNGIAFDSVQNRLFVTGKNWPHLFELKYPTH